MAALVVPRRARSQPQRRRLWLPAQRCWPSWPAATGAAEVVAATVEVTADPAEVVAARPKHCWRLPRSQPWLQRHCLRPRWPRSRPQQQRSWPPQCSMALSTAISLAFGIVTSPPTNSILKKDRNAPLPRMLNLLIVVVASQTLFSSWKENIILVTYFFLLTFQLKARGESTVVLSDLFPYSSNWCAQQDT